MSRALYFGDQADKSTQGAPLETITDIMSQTMQGRDEAIQILEAVQAGAVLATGITRERAVQMLIESIAFYEQMLRRYGWRGDAPKGQNRPGVDGCHREEIILREF
jgi:hypothetical protein